MELRVQSEDFRPESGHLGFQCRLPYAGLHAGCFARSLISSNKSDSLSLSSIFHMGKLRGSQVLSEQRAGPGL